jgi:hypothetical protein
MVSATTEEKKFKKMHRRNRLLIVIPILLSLSSVTYGQVPVKNIQKK